MTGDRIETVRTLAEHLGLADWRIGAAEKLATALAESDKRWKERKLQRIGVGSAETDVP